MTDLDKAREWAKRWECATVPTDTRTAIDLIQSLPDQWVDAEKVRELVVKYEAFAEDAEPEGEKGRIRAALYRNFVGVLEALLTTPSLPEPSDWQDDRFTGWLLNENVAVKVNPRCAVIIEHMDVGWFALPPEEASRFADMIKAAANYAEQEHN